MGMQGMTFEERLHRVNERAEAAQEVKANKAAELRQQMIENQDEGPAVYDRSNAMFAALMVSSFLGVCALGAMAFDLTISIQNFSEVAIK